MALFRDLVLVGRVVKPQGRHGEVAIAPLSDRPDRFPTLRRAFVPAPDGGAREIRILACRAHKGRFVLRVEGVSTIDEAETLRGAELRIAEEELPVLPAGSFYHHELVGLRAVDERGAEVGAVAEVVETGAETRVLVLRGPDGETLLPFAEGFVKAVDKAGGTIVVLRPEYVVAD
jgi:16S rRNA processing protein RimM